MIDLKYFMKYRKSKEQRVGQYFTWVIGVNDNEKCAVNVKVKSPICATFPVVGDFAKRVAELAYGIKSDNWNHVSKAFPELEQERQLVEKVVEENVKVDNIELMLV